MAETSNGLPRIIKRNLHGSAARAKPTPMAIAIQKAKHEKAPPRASKSKRIVHVD